MSVDKRTVAVFAAAAAIRLLLFTAFPQLPDTLTGRVEISTPVTSFKRLQEGLFLYNHNVSPYDGGVYHQAPLLLPFFSLLPDYKTWPLFTNLIYILVDLLSAVALMKIADSGESVSSKLYTSPRKDRRWSSTIVSAFFLLNPFTIATCIARPTIVFSTCAILHAVSRAVVGASFTSMFALAIASYLSMYPILLLPPLALLCYDRRCNEKTTFASSISKSIALITGSLSALLGSSYLLTNSWEFLASTYGVSLLLPDLTPNVGLWWYFFIEMFDSFRNFFLAVFQLHLSSYSLGLTIRLRSQPLFVIATLCGILAIFKPYTSIADFSLYLAFLPLYRHVFPLMRYTFVASTVVLLASMLGPSFWHLWIYAGSGNANFFYAITLVWGLGLAVLVSDALYAVLRDEWEVERPEMRGKEVKQI